MSAKRASKHVRGSGSPDHAITNAILLPRRWAGGSAS